MALSITFRKDIVGTHAAICMWMLQWSWIAFTTAVICCTIYKLSKANAHAKIVQAVISGQSQGLVSIGLCYDICFQVGTWTFLSGVSALAAFALRNA